MDTTVDTTVGSGTWFGLTDTYQSPEESTPSLGWGQSGNNETDQPTNETFGGGWGEGETNQGWGGGGTNDTGSGWGGGDSGGGGWGNSGGDLSSSVNDSGSGGGGGWGNTSWGQTNLGDGDGEGSSAKDSGSGRGGWGQGDGGGWGSSANDSGSGGGGWGSTTTKDNNNTDTNQPAAHTESNPPIVVPSEGTWGSSDNTWGSSSNDTWGLPDWGSSNNNWASSNETSQPEPASDPGPDRGKGRQWGTSTQRSGWGDTSNSETVTGLPSSGGGWANTTPSVPTSVGVTRGNCSLLVPPFFPEWYAHVIYFLDDTSATPRIDNPPATMDVDGGEPHFENKSILNTMENLVQRRRNKRKRSQENIRQNPRYYRHLLAPQRDPSAGIDGDGDAVMGEIADRSTRDRSVEAGEIFEVLPCVEYDMNVLSCEPKTSEEKTKFAKHLL